MEQLFAFPYLEKSDQNKYGTLLKGLNSQKSLGHDGLVPKNAKQLKQRFKKPKNWIFVDDLCGT